METSASKKIGILYTLYFISLAVLIALGLFYILTGGEGLETIQLYPMSFMFTTIGMFVGGYFFGGFAGKLIEKKRDYPKLIGIATALLTIFIGALTGFTASYISTANKPENDQLNYMIEFIINPSLGAVVIGFLPSLILGSLLGIKIKKKIHPIETKTNNIKK